jgi:hypothetical protein
MTSALAFRNAARYGYREVQPQLLLSSMKKRITNVCPVQLGKVLAALYACLGLIAAPIIILITVFAPKGEHGIGLAMGLGIAVMIPILYAIMGFIGGLLVGVIYNLLAIPTGGIEITLADAPTAIVGPVVGTGG